MTVKTNPLKPELRGMMIEAGNKLFIKFGPGGYGWMTLFRVLGALDMFATFIALFMAGDMKQQLSIFALAGSYIFASNAWYDITDFYQEPKMK
jgi:hypothetical protein